MSKWGFRITLLVVSIASIIVGAMLHRHRAAIVNLIPNEPRKSQVIATELPEDLDTLKIIIKPENFGLLEENRRVALEAGVLRNTHRDKV